MIKVTFFEGCVSLVKFCNEHDIRKEQIIQIVKGPVLSETPLALFWEDNTPHPRVKKAKEIFTDISKIDAIFEEKNKHFFNECGIQLRKQGLYEEAIDYYAKALSVCSDDENLHFNLARALFENGDVEKAQEGINKVLGMNPDHKEAKEFLQVGHPKKGPFHSRRPDRIIRRTVRGMLPYKQPKGKHAQKRLKAFIGIPEELKDQNMETLAQADAKKLTCPYFTLAELAEEIGWNRGE